uniref:WD repeat containing, antisense to TP73 n=1 Tax=Astyanax mexicanus TaxID=7994 RepID=A0A8B9HS55_ASTMX
MNFSEVFKQSNQLCKISPDGKYLATCVQYRLVVRDVNTLQILQLFTCLDQVAHMEWSSDSLFILCAMYKRGLVQVWSLEQPEWHCKIDEGSIGLVSSRWSPDGRHILNTTEFHVSVKSGGVCPALCQLLLADGRYMALVERRDCKDFISIFVCDDWHLLRHFETETQDLSGVEWSPNGCVLAAWDSCLEYKMLLYSLDGRLLSTYSAYEWSLGIKSVAWSPSSQFLAIGSYDEKVRILNHITWKKLIEFEHPATITSSKAVVYKEVEKKPVIGTEDLSVHQIAMGSSLFNTKSNYEITSLPVQVPVVKPDTDRANPKIGISTIAFSADNRYLATKNDNMPQSLWVWDMQRLGLQAVLEQTAPVRCFVWDPCRPRLALCTGNNKIYMWSPAGCISVKVQVEGSFQVQSIMWHGSGDSLVLLGKDQLCLCYLATDEEK